MASKAQAKKTYQHFVPAAKPVPNWYENYNFVLIENMQQLEKSFTDAGWTPGKSFMSFDTETTGLNFEELDLVGFSYSINGVSTYYVPVDHFECPINLGEPAVEFIYQRMCEARQVFMYNARYDERVLEARFYKDHKAELDKKRWLYVKYDMSKVNVFDVMNSVFDSDSNDKLPSLKSSALHFLGYDMMHFDEVIAEAGNFYYLNPKNNFDAVYYAASDALCTYLLAIATLKYYQEAGMAGKLDNMVIYPLMHYESEKLWLDKERLRTLYDECVKEVDRLEHEVYSSFGYQINLNSPVQVAQALERLGIDTGERTASGNMATGMHVLENLPQDLRDKFPALDAFLKYKEVNKLLTSYFKVYLKEAESKGYIRANYKLHGVPTGRLASGKDGKNTYFSPTNIQAVPKPHVAMYDVFDLGSAYRNFFSKKNNIIMGYVFSPAKYNENKKHIVPDDPRYIGWAEGMNPYLNIRSCVTGKMYEDSKDDEWVLAAVDYCIDPNTLVELENGNIVKLCDLREGQKIKTPYGFYPVHNFHYTGKKQKCILAMRSGKFVVCSPDHKFMVKESNTIVWKTLSELHTRDNIVTYNTNTYEDTIDYIKITNEYMNMCDIEVEEVHCYYANGIVTHNCAQELRITANLSHEPTWENAFVEGRDVHKSTAEIVWGKENYNKDYRKMAKGVNFCSCVNNLILVKNRGYVKAEDLQIGNSLVSGLDFNASNHVLNLQRLNNQNCYEIQFSNGIKASYREGHKLLCRNVHDGSNYWKRVEDIVKDNDYIIVKHCRRFFENLSEGYKGNIYDENFVQCNADDIENVIESRIGIKKVYSGISNKERDLIALMSNSLGYSTYLKEDGSLVVNYLKGSPIPEDLNGDGVSYTQVSSFSKYIDDIIAVECETHEYIDSCLISHNSIIYGASAASFIDPLYKISTMAEAEEFYNNYKSKLPTLFQWIDMKQRQGRRNGTVYTYFGRPRRVKGYFDNGNASFANRTITNTSVQGTAADILKLVMIRLWKNLLNNPEYKDDVRFQCTIHDEIQYSVKASRVNEILGLIEDNQTLRLKEWRVPITTEGSLGFSMGGLFAFERIFDNEEKTKWHYVPKLDD